MSAQDEPHPDPDEAPTPEELLDAWADELTARIHEHQALLGRRRD